MKTRPPKTCGWCGAKLRLAGPGGSRGGCPRGPQCAEDQRRHDDMMTLIAAQDEVKRGRSATARTASPAASAEAVD